MRKLTSAIVAIALLVTPALAAVEVVFDPGGSIIEYIDKYKTLREAEGKLRIDGLCISACTLFTGILKDEQVCVTPRAKLAFHSATQRGEYSAEATRIAWELYPNWVHVALNAQGWNGDTEHAELIYVRGDELRKVYRSCETEPRT